MMNLDLEDEALPDQPGEAQEEMRLLTVASQVLSVIWKSIDPDYKATYRAEIWRQFEERIATAARMTATLQAFLSRLCGMFQIASLGTDEQSRALVMDVLHGHAGNQDALLQVIRANPVLCAVQVRVWNDQEKAEKAVQRLDFQTAFGLSVKPTP